MQSSPLHCLLILWRKAHDEKCWFIDIKGNYLSIDPQSVQMKRQRLKIWPGLRLKAAPNVTYWPATCVVAAPSLWIAAITEESVQFSQNKGGGLFDWLQGHTAALTALSLLIKAWTSNSLVFVTKYGCLANLLCRLPFPVQSSQFVDFFRAYLYQCLLIYIR